MAPEIRKEELAAQAQGRAQELAAELARRRGLPAEPGDLFVLPATSELPVEWAILERGTGGKLLAVPADSGLPAGTADVEVPADAPGGPLSLRCRFGVWLEGALFKPDLRSGVLAPETVAEALHRVRQVESGTLAGSPLGEEVDADPEYRDWIRDVPERARELAVAALPSNVRRFPVRFGGAAHKLAAVFALAAIGLSVWNGRLLREVEQLSVPIFNAPSGEVSLGSEVRGGTILSVPKTASHVILTLALDLSIEPQDGRLEIVNRFGQPVWKSPIVPLTPGAEFGLVLPRKLLPYGDYRVRVYPASGTQPLAEQPLRIEIAE
jgi:hypothetical protein